MAGLSLTLLAGSLEAQAQEKNESRNYFARTSNVKEKPKPVVTANGEASADEPEQRKDFIGRLFPFRSMCDWTPGMRFMVKPSQKDLVIKTFTETKTGNMISTRRLENQVLVYDGHSNVTGSLHEHVDFHLEGNAAERYYFEVPTSTFDDYCFGKVGVPALAYLGDVDMAMDSLVGKKVRVLVRWLYQDSDTDGGGYKPIDIGADRRGSVMTITKVGVGTRNFPVKIIVKEPDKDGMEGQEYFQNVTISRTNCGYRSDELETEETKAFTFEGSFQLLDDKMSVSKELKEAYMDKLFYTFYNTTMRNASEQLVKIARLSTFKITDIYRLGDSNTVTLTLESAKTGETFTKEVSLNFSKVESGEEVLEELFIEGDPEKIEGVAEANLPFIRRQQVKKGFTEAEVRLALGEPTDITRITADKYQWTYLFKNDKGRPFRVVKFFYKTKKVAEDMTK